MMGDEMEARIKRKSWERGSKSWEDRRRSSKMTSGLIYRTRDDGRNGCIFSLFFYFPLCMLSIHQKMRMSRVSRTPLGTPSGVNWHKTFLLLMLTLFMILVLLLPHSLLLWWWWYPVVILQQEPHHIRCHPIQRVDIRTFFFRFLPSLPHQHFLPSSQFLILRVKDDDDDVLFLCNSCFVQISGSSTRIQ